MLEKTVKLVQAVKGVLMKYWQLQKIQVLDSFSQDLHEYNQDYPLAPTKEVLPEEWLSDYQRDLAEQKKSNDNYRVALAK